MVHYSAQPEGWIQALTQASVYIDRNLAETRALELVSASTSAPLLSQVRKVALTMPMRRYLILSIETISGKLLTLVVSYLTYLLQATR